MEAQWQATDTLRFAGNVTHMKEVESSLRDLGIPLQQAYLRTDWQFLPKWHWNLQANWFDERPLPAGNPRDETGAYTLADTTVRYIHSKQWEFAASVRNLFDKEAWDYSHSRLTNNLPLPERNFYAEVRYKF
jgi:iron complex outermembrane receptor protein